MKRFIIVVDMQRDFVAPDGALPVPGAAALPLPLQAWLKELRADTTAGVLFTRDTHDLELYARSPEAKQFPPHCLRGTPGWAFVVDPTAIASDIPCYILEKGVFDMWAEPGLVMVRRDAVTIDRDRFFADLLGQGLAVTVVGVAADYCVRWAVEGLVARGFQVTVPSDLTRGIDREIARVKSEEWPDVDVAIPKNADMLIEQVAD